MRLLCALLMLLILPLFSPPDVPEPASAAVLLELDEVPDVPGVKVDAGVVDVGGEFALLSATVSAPVFVPKTADRVAMAPIVRCPGDTRSSDAGDHVLTLMPGEVTEDHSAGSRRWAPFALRRSGARRSVV